MRKGESSSEYKTIETYCSDVWQEFCIINFFQIFVHVAKVVNDVIHGAIRTTKSANVLSATCNELCCYVSVLICGLH